MIADKSRIWALAVNGVRARILRGVASLGNAEPVELVMKSEARHLRDIIAQEPRKLPDEESGRWRATVRKAGYSIAEDERDFLRQVIALLESHRRAGEFDELAIFAEREVLAHLRDLMPDNLRALVSREVARSLLQLSPHDLVAAIADELNNGSHIHESPVRG